jgi:hypothetical protein
MDRTTAERVGQVELAPHSLITSAGQYQRRWLRAPPRGALRPWRAQRRAAGSLSMRTVLRVPPSALRYTIPDRLRCRSMPTQPRCRSTGPSFRRFRVGFGTPSVLDALGSRRPAATRRSTLLARCFASAMNTVLGPPAPARPISTDGDLTRERRHAPSWHQGHDGARSTRGESRAKATCQRAALSRPDSLHASIAKRSSSVARTLISSFRNNIQRSTNRSRDHRLAMSS